MLLFQNSFPVTYLVRICIDIGLFSINCQHEPGKHGNEGGQRDNLKFITLQHNNALSHAYDITRRGKFELTDQDRSGAETDPRMLICGRFENDILPAPRNAPFPQFCVQPHVRK